MADRTEWQRAVEPQLRALGREIEVPPASDLTGGATYLPCGPAPFDAGRSGVLRWL